MARKSLQALVRCLGKSENAHSDGLVMFEKANKHRAKAMRHAAAIAASQGADNDDPDDGDDDGDTELAYEAARRKRMIVIARKSWSGARTADAARRARAIEIARLARSA